MWLVKYALRRPYSMGALAILVFILGLSTLRQLPVDILPEVKTPVVNVVWTYPGLNAREMASKITSFGELALLNNVDNVKEISSETFNGVGLIRVVFQNNVEIDVAYLTLKAPFDGVITERNIDRGDRVSPNDTMMLYRIINSDVIRVQVDVPQPQLFRIEQAGDASLSLTERPGLRIPVSFKRSSQELRSDTGTVRLEYEFDNRELALPAGLNAMLQLASNGKGNSVTVPANTIVYWDGSASLVVLSADDKVEFRKVTLGKNFPTTVEVLQGVSDQDRVVVNPNALLKEGQLVEVAAAKS